MFDNPLAYPLPQPAPKFDPRIAAFIAAISVLIVISAHLLPRVHETIIGSPSHLREIEIFTTQGQTAFYLHNAGYRLLHRRQLIAVIAGCGTWSVIWPGPDAVRIACNTQWSRVTFFNPPGITVAIAAPAPPRTAP